ncbi:MAG: carboxymuconolactone decarboxylase family protein [Deltaproteobacteria bacterium]|nr:carboxymuconolactone decarboxylase family protein [Deltaproteobacteria bacterium]
MIIIAVGGSPMRIAPAQPPHPEEIQARLDRIMPPGVAPLTLFTTLARSPRVFERFMAGGLLDRGALTMRQRELMIDRTSARCGNAYEWGVHVTLFGARVGLDEAALEALANGDASDARWAADEQAILALADDLHATARISEATWSALREHFDESQILELIALAGFYRTVAYFCNGLELAPEPYASPLPPPRAGDVRAR